MSSSTLLSRHGTSRFIMYYFNCNCSYKQKKSLLYCNAVVVVGFFCRHYSLTCRCWKGSFPPSTHVSSTRRVFFLGYTFFFVTGLKSNSNLKYHYNFCLNNNWIAIWNLATYINYFTMRRPLRPLSTWWYFHCAGAVRVQCDWPRSRDKCPSFSASPPILCEWSAKCSSRIATTQQLTSVDP